MWFVILALLIVAAYFLYDALRDRRLEQSGNSLSSARRVTLDDASGVQGAVSAPGHDAAPQTKNRVNNEFQPESTPSGNPGVDAVSASVAGRHDAAETGSSGKLQFLDTPIGGQQDDLTRIDGVGPVIESELNKLGIFHYHQIGNFSDSDVNSVNAELGFPGRIERENWVAQARHLMTGSAARGNNATAETASSAPNGTTHTPEANNNVATAVGAVTAATATAVAASSAFGADDFTLTEADYTGAWNTDLTIEIQERLKVLNTRESDAPRLDLSVDQYRAIKNGDDDQFSREQLTAVLERLRQL